MNKKTASRSGFIPPSIEEIVSDTAYADWVERLSRPLVTSLVREAVLRTREQPDANLEVLDQTVREHLGRWERNAQTPVINATGVLIHTNLGRAPLDLAFWNEVAERLEGYHSLELDLESGERGKRGPLVNRLLVELSGAEAGLVVNNGAAAVLLMLCLARGHRVLVSRGELVQIGGGFRIPEILAQSGATLVEVGTTNQTTLKDYQNAEGAKAVLKVHRSNFSMSGFVKDVEPKHLRALCDQNEWYLFEDLGSGAVSDLSKYGLPRERTVADAVADGVDVVCFSGDKLLGGPQAGCMVGKKKAIAALAGHQLYRALRPDKITLAALEVSLLAHLAGKSEESLPLYRLLATTKKELLTRAKHLKADVKNCRLDIVDSNAVTGGGSLPGAEIASVALAATPKSAERAALALRQRALPVLARVQNGRLLFDLKTVFPEQDQELERAISDCVETS